VGDACFSLRWLPGPQASCPAAGAASGGNATTRRQAAPRLQEPARYVIPPAHLCLRHKCRQAALEGHKDRQAREPPQGAINPLDAA